MSLAATARLQPRKTPVQARSAASVEAILQATVQVLLKDGKSKLTTTRIAARAGVSVGTLYQYFPNKTALLRALLKEHLDGVALAMEIACEAAHGETLGSMAETITLAFVQAKLRHSDVSVALYAISDDVEGRSIARDMHQRSITAMTGMLQTAQDETIAAPNIVAATLLSAMAGVSRAALERDTPQVAAATIKEQLLVLVHAYLHASVISRRRKPGTS